MMRIVSATSLAVVATFDFGNGEFEFGGVTSEARKSCGCLQSHFICRPPAAEALSVASEEDDMRGMCPALQFDSFDDFSINCVQLYAEMNAIAEGEYFAAANAAAKKRKKKKKKTKCVPQVKASGAATDSSLEDDWKELYKGSLFWDNPIVPVNKTFVGTGYADAVGAQTSLMIQMPLGAGRESEVWTACLEDSGVEVAVKLVRRGYGKDETVPTSKSVRRRNQGSYNDFTRFSNQEAELKGVGTEFILHPMFCFEVLEYPERTLPDENWTNFYSGLGCAYELADQDLRRMMNDNRDRRPEDRLKKHELASIFYRIGRGIREMLVAGRVWMDAKPANVLMFGKIPKISDVGFTKKPGESAALPCAGTRGYKPPEIERLAARVAASKGYRSIEARIIPHFATFGWGSVFYYVAFGERAWSREKIAQLTDDDVVEFGEMEYMDEDDREAESDPEWAADKAAKCSLRLMKDMLERALRPNWKRRWPLSRLLRHPFFKKCCKPCALHVETEADYWDTRERRARDGPDEFCCPFTRSDLEVLDAERMAPTLVTLNELKLPAPKLEHPQAVLAKLTTRNPVCQEAVVNQLGDFADLIERVEGKDSDDVKLQDSSRMEAHREFRATSRIWGFPTVKFTKSFIGPSGEGHVDDMDEMTFVKPLGTGRESEVWLACEESSGVKYAVKVIRRLYEVDEDFSMRDVNKKNAASITDFTKLFQEDGLAAGITDRYIVAPRFCYYTEAYPERTLPDEDCLNFYSGYGCVYDLAEEDFSDRLWRNRKATAEERLTIGQIASLVYRVGRGLREIYKIGRIWIDCKPSNVLMINGLTKVSDVGFMKTVRQVASIPCGGTKGYKPPEIERLAKRVEDGEENDKPDIAARIYTSFASFSLGATMFLAFFDERPWSRKEITFLHDDSEVVFPVVRYSLESGQDQDEDEANPPLTELDDLWSVPCSTRLLKNLLRGAVHPDPTRRMAVSEMLGHPFFRKCCPECREGEEGMCCAFDEEMEVLPIELAGRSRHSVEVLSDDELSVESSEEAYETSDEEDEE